MKELELTMTSYKLKSEDGEEESVGGDKSDKELSRMSRAEKVEWMSNRLRGDSDKFMEILESFEPDEARQRVASLRALKWLVSKSNK